MVSPMDLGRVGLWTFTLRSVGGGQLGEIVHELEELGYGAIWFPGGPPDAAFAHARDLLDASERLAVATGIVSIWSGGAASVAGHNRSLRDAHPARFVLGLGVSHPEAVDRQEPGRYRRPLGAMAAYLDELDEVDPEAGAGQRVLAALGPEMLALSARRAAGAHPYFAPVEHTSFARSRLGPSALLAPEQAVVLDTDRDRAREIARSHMAIYLQLVNYTSNLRRFGFTDDDIGGGGSDRLVDAIVAWGDEDAVLERVRAHHSAGADHVCLQVLGEDARAVPMAQWRRLGPVHTM